MTRQGSLQEEGSGTFGVRKHHWGVCGRVDTECDSHRRVAGFNSSNMHKEMVASSSAGVQIALLSDCSCSWAFLSSLAFRCPCPPPISNPFRSSQLYSSLSIFSTSAKPKRDTWGMKVPWFSPALREQMGYLCPWECQRWGWKQQAQIGVGSWAFC